MHITHTSIYAGYPVLNDPLYDHPAWGPNKGKKGEGLRDMKEVCACCIMGHTLFH